MRDVGTLQRSDQPVLATNAVEPVGDSKLVRTAISGMLSGLDPRSVYLTEDEYKALQSKAPEDNAATGLVLTMDNSIAKVVSPRDGSPAGAADIKPGDLIFSIDKEPTYDMTLPEIEQKLRGAADSEVTLMVRRGSGILNFGDLAGRTIVLTRGTVHEIAVPQLAARRKLDIKFVYAADHDESFRTLAAGKDCFDALRAGLPAGTVTGAPKVRAMEIIDEVEPHRRGPYAGAVGYIDFTGNMDTCIALRTLVLQGRTAYVQAGGGVVYDSIPSDEYEETVNKARGLLKAIEIAQTQL